MSTWEGAQGPYEVKKHVVEQDPGEVVFVLKTFAISF